MARMDTASEGQHVRGGIITNPGSDLPRHARRIGDGARQLVHFQSERQLRQQFYHKLEPNSRIITLTVHYFITP